MPVIPETRPTSGRMGVLSTAGGYLTLDVERIRWDAERRALRMAGKPMQAMLEYPR